MIKEIKNLNLELVKKYFTFLFKTGNLTALKDIIHTEAVYNQAIGLPYGGTHQGFNEWIKIFVKIQHYFLTELLHEPVYYCEEENNTIIAYYTVNLSSKKAQISMNISELIEFNNEKITCVTPFYFDTNAVLEFIKNR